MDDIVFILEEEVEEGEHPEFYEEMDVYAVVSVDVDGKYSIIQVLNEPEKEILNDVEDILPEYDAEEAPGVYVMKFSPTYECPQGYHESPECEIEIIFTMVEDLNDFIFDGESVEN